MELETRQAVIQHDDHQMVVSLSDKLQTALAESVSDSSKTAKARALFEQLGNRMRAHFSREESTMAALGYERAASHYVAHAAIMDWYDRRHVELENASGRERLSRSLAKDLKRLLRDHADMFDADLSRAIKSRPAA